MKQNWNAYYVPLANFQLHSLSSQLPCFMSSEQLRAAQGQSVYSEPP